MLLIVVVKVRKGKVTKAMFHENLQKTFTSISKCFGNVCVFSLLGRWICSFGRESWRSEISRQIIAVTRIIVHGERMDRHSAGNHGYFASYKRMLTRVLSPSREREIDHRDYELARTRAYHNRSEICEPMLSVSKMVAMGWLYELSSWKRRVGRR